MLTEHSRWIWIDFNRDPITNSEHKEPYIYLIQIAINFALFPNGSMSIPSTLKWISRKTKWINLHTYRHIDELTETKTYLVSIYQVLPLAFALLGAPPETLLLHPRRNELPQSLVPLCLSEILLKLSPDCNEFLGLIESPLRNPITLLEVVIKTTTAIVCKKATVIGSSKVVSRGNCNSGS